MVAWFHVQFNCTLCILQTYELFSPNIRMIDSCFLLYTTIAEVTFIAKLFNIVTAKVGFIYLFYLLLSLT